MIAGAGGFIGLNFLSYLETRMDHLRRYEKIVLIDPLQYGRQKIPQRILNDGRFDFIGGSIYDPKILTSAIGEGDLIVHLAAEVNSFTEPQAGSADEPVRYLQRLVDAQIGRLLFVSTADIYGLNNSHDLLETDQVRPTTIYAAAKAAFEAYLWAFHALYSLPVIVFRPVTIYGPSQYPGWLVPRVITQALSNEPISISGNGSVKRDWIYVDDVCDLLYRAALFDGDQHHGEVFNVGTGAEATVLALTRQVLKLTDQPESLIHFVPDRSGDIKRQITQGKRARAAFQWNPGVSLCDGIARTVDWYHEYWKQG